MNEFHCHLVSLSTGSLCLLLCTVQCMPDQLCPSLGDVSKQSTAGASLIPSLQPSWSPLIPPLLLYSGGIFRYSILNWILLPNKCGEWFFTAWTVFPFSKQSCWVLLRTPRTLVLYNHQSHIYLQSSTMQLDPLVHNQQRTAAECSP